MTVLQINFDAGRDLSVREAELLHRFMVREARRALREWDEEDAKKADKADRA